MKTLVKLLVALTCLAGVCLAVACYLQQKAEPDYISIYGGPTEE